MTDVRSGVPLLRVELANDAGIARSTARLLRSDYDPRSVVEETSADPWPGDLAGRLLLSLSRYARAGLQTDRAADALFAEMSAAIRERGYFGPPLGPTRDEQQLACHGWVVAGFLQYHHLTGEESARVAALRVIDELILPGLGSLGDYPVDRAPVEDGAASGQIGLRTPEWDLSTDTYCVLLCLNGLVPAYLETGRADLLAAVRGLADLVAAIDVVSTRAQLHAVLAAARCLSDLAVAGQDEFRDLASSLFDTYRNHAQSLTFAPYNWFGRADSWSEPCAMVDALGVAQNLWRITGDPGYLEEIARTEHNALAFAHRADGSFGLDSLPTVDDPALRRIHDDARWCCTMRGSIGVLEVRENSVEFDPDTATLTILDPHSGSVTLATADGEWELRITANWPADSTVRVEAHRAPHDGALTVGLHPVRGGGEIALGGSQGYAGTLTAVAPHVVDPIGRGLAREFRGPTLRVSAGADETGDRWLDEGLSVDEGALVVAFPVRGGES